MTPQTKRRIEQIRRGEVPEGYKKTKIGIVPEEWDTPKAKEIFSSVSDKNHNGNLEVLSATQDRGVIPRSQVDIDIKYDKSSVSGYKKVSKGNYVISLRSFQGGIEYSEYDGLVSPAYIVLKEKIEICQLFFKTYFKTDDYIKRLAVATYGIRDGKSISFENFGALRIPFPPLFEQKKIAEILQTQDKLIELQQKKIEELKKLKKVYLSKMFPKKGCNIPEIRFPGFTDPWEQRKLGDLGSLKNGMNFSKEAMGVGFPFVNLQNIFGNNVIDVSDLGKAIASDSQLKDYNLLNGDVLFVRSSVKLEGVGEVALVPQTLENTTYSGFIIRFRDEYGLDNNFKRFVFGIESVRNQIMSQATNSANKNISQSVLENLELAIPGESEQQKIGAYFSNLDHLITLHQRKLEAMKTYKKSLMQLLLTGIVRTKGGSKCLSLQNR